MYHYENPVIRLKIPRKKYLTVGKNKTGGRNNFGRITAYHRGGGHKRLTRIIDYFRFI
jgi:ribosomal protein L2